MSDTVNRVITLATFGGIAGLIVLNWQGSNTLFHTIASGGTSYVKTLQGR